PDRSCGGRTSNLANGCPVSRGVESARDRSDEFPAFCPDRMGRGESSQGGGTSFQGDWKPWNRHAPLDDAASGDGVFSPVPNEWDRTDHGPSAGEPRVAPDRHL